MPSTNIKDANLQDQIDAYVRGKMLPDEEIQFEAKYLDDTEVVKEIERLYGLKQGLVFLMSKNNSFMDRIQGMINYLVLPKPAWRTVAAAILLIPIGFIFHENLSVFSEDKNSLYIISENRTRSAAEENATELLIPNNQEKFWLGFKVPPLEKSKTWSLKISNTSKQIVWQGDNLYLDEKSSCHQLVICTLMSGKVLLQGEYDYILMSKDNQDLVVEGKFKVIHQ